LYKVSHISTSSSEGGSAISARRIHIHLRSKKINSELFVGDIEDKDNKIFLFTKSKILRLLDKPFNYFLNKLGLQYFFLPSNLFINNKIFKSSIIQLYNIHGGYFQLSSLEKLNKNIPVVWRLSDYWSMTGHCAYPGECNKWKKICEKCPSLKGYPEIGLDNTTVIWKKKQRLIKNLNIKIIVPSTRMFKNVKKSPILKNKDVFIIPNGVDTEKFKPSNKIKAKRRLKVSNKFSVLFIAQVAFDNFRKGTHIVKQILDKFKEDKKIQFFIAGINSENWNRYSFKNLDCFSYNKRIEWKSLLYNAADVVIVPSINENFPNVILESMSCGTPVISFDTGGIDDIISETNGILIEKLDTKKFIESIALLAKNKNLQKKLKKNCRQTILKRYSVQNEVKKYIQIYEKIINEKD
tara:strand:+ start:249 stop:1475 length:1227 start_codon:yes stop_codon:yes gene_type:complete